MGGLKGFVKIQLTDILCPPDVHLSVVVPDVVEPPPVHGEEPPRDGGGPDGLDGGATSAHQIRGDGVPLEVEAGVETSPHRRTGYRVLHVVLVDDVDHGRGNHCAILEDQIKKRESENQLWESDFHKVSC